VNTARAAKYLGLSAGTLQNLRSAGLGPKHTKIRTVGESGPARVSYARADLDDWSRAARCPTCGSYRPHVLQRKAAAS
jgi:hypothetical protein